MQLKKGLGLVWLKLRYSGFLAEAVGAEEAGLGVGVVLLLNPEGECLLGASAPEL